MADDLVLRVPCALASVFSLVGRRVVLRVRAARRLSDD